MRYTIILIIFFKSLVYSQQKEKILYLKDNNPIINADENGCLHYLISIKSLNKDFNSDAYKFIIPNRVNFDKFKNLKDLENNIHLDSIHNIVNLKNLEKDEPCEIHNKLSIQKKIYLVYKTNNKYVYIPIVYKGTQKNIESMKF